MMCLAVGGPFRADQPSHGAARRSGGAERRRRCGASRPAAQPEARAPILRGDFGLCDPRSAD